MYRLSDIADKKFCVVGDMIVDHYRYLSASRLSPEAPVIIFNPLSDEHRFGGAGNVAENLCALGAGVMLCAVMGYDHEEKCRQLYRRFPRLSSGMVPLHLLPLGDSHNFRFAPIIDQTRITTVKERLVSAKFQQVARIDIQDRRPISGEVASRLVACSVRLIKDADVVVLSDYDHGVMTPDVVSCLMDAAKGKPVIVDSKSMDTMSKYRGCTVFKANDIEARRMSRLDEEFDDEHMAGYMRKIMRCDAAAITVGARGIVLADGGGIKTCPAVTPHGRDEVVDVTGAGDTVMAAIAVGISIGMPYDLAIKLANVAAGIVVHKNGVATATVDEVMSMVGQLHPLELEIGR